MQFDELTTRKEQRKTNKNNRIKTRVCAAFAFIDMGNSTSKGDGSAGSDAAEVPDGKTKGNKSGHQTNGQSNAIATASSAAMLKAESTMSRSASGADVTEKYFTQLVPIEKLSEILKEKTSAKHGINNGIAADVFVVSLLWYSALLLTFLIYS